MDATGLVNELRNQGLALSAVGNAALRVLPSDRITDRHRAIIREHKPALLKLLASKQGATYRINPIAQTIAAELGTTPEFCLSLLDDSDIEAILTNSDPGRLNSWRGFVGLALAKSSGQPDPSDTPDAPNEGDSAELWVIAWTPSGSPVKVRADSPEHAEQIRRWNPAPTKGAKP